MPPTLPTTAAEIELMVRELLADKSRAVAGVGHVFTKRFYIVGKQQYVEKLGIENAPDGDIKVRCLFIEFVGYEDTAKGCDEAPVFNLVYSFRAIHEFEDERADGSCSSDDFAAFVMNLRAAFLPARHLGFPDNLYHTPLLMPDRIRIDEDELTGAFGHIAPFVLKVELATGD